MDMNMNGQVNNYFILTILYWPAYASLRDGVFEVYGEYTEGLEEAKAKILAFCGEDFLSPGFKTEKPPAFAKEIAKTGGEIPN